MDGFALPKNKEVLEMETKKLTVEIELSKEEAERFERFIEEGCYDQDKYLKHLLLKGIEHVMKNAKATMPQSSLG
jgi:hypothetical protein